MFTFTCDYCRSKTAVSPVRWVRRYWYRLRYQTRTVYYDGDDCFVNALAEDR